MSGKQFEDLPSPTSYLNRPVEAYAEPDDPYVEDVLREEEMETRVHPVVFKHQQRASVMALYERLTPLATVIYEGRGLIADAALLDGEQGRLMRELDDLLAEAIEVAKKLEYRIEQLREMDAR